MITARSTISKLSKGFTLIELLVVLGILGILATALVATIDPFEQLKKANDSNVKNSAVELVNASLRYYTTHNDMPWGTTNGVTSCGTTGAISAAVINTGGGLTCVNGLITDGELKQQFTSATSITGSIYLNGTSGATSNTVTACYQPQSKSQQKDVNTKFNNDGTTATAGSCKSAGGATNCYWCATL